MKNKLVAGALVAGLLLSGCSSGLGALAGGIAGTLGTGFTQATQQKIADRAIWRQKHQELGNDILDLYEDAADKAKASGKFEAAIEHLQAGIKFHETMWPELLIERAVKRALGSRPAESSATE